VFPEVYDMETGCFCYYAIDMGYILLHANFCVWLSSLISKNRAILQNGGVGSRHFSEMSQIVQT
jgi:hypothetical protein